MTKSEKEKVAQLSDEQWAVLKAALDGEVAFLRANLRDSAERLGMLVAAYHNMVCGMDGPYWECIYPICLATRTTYLHLKAISGEGEKHDCEKPEREAVLAAVLKAVPLRIDGEWDDLKGWSDRFERWLGGQAARVLADLSKAAKEILEKAQTHDAVKAENKRLRDALIEPINDVRGKPTLQGCKACRNLWRKDGPQKHLKGCVLLEANGCSEREKVCSTK